MGLKLGDLGFSPVIKVTVVCQVHLSLAHLWSEHEDKHVYNTTQRAKIMDAFALHLFLHVWLAKSTKSPSLSPMADNAITGV